MSTVMIERTCVCCLDISEIDRGMYRHFYDSASEERKQSADRYRCFADSVRCVTADALLRFALLSVGADPSQAVIERDAHGKPSVKCIDGFHYNLSHSGQRVVIAYGSHPLGVDVELVRSAADRERMAHRFFTDEERAYISRETDSTARAERWTRVWTMKESYLKYLGIGLSRGLDSFSVCANGALGRVRDPLLPDREVPVLHGLLPDADHCLAVCCHDAELSVTYITASELMNALAF